MEAGDQVALVVLQDVQVWFFVCSVIPRFIPRLYLSLVSNTGPATARVAGPVPHVAISQAAQPSVRPRPSVARATIRPPAPPPVRPSTAPIRGTLNRSTAPTVAHPQPAAPAMYVARNAHFSQVGPRR